MLALCSFLLWMVLGAGVHQSLLIAAAVLIITCPCALGLAVPAAQIVASGSLMRAGVLVKDGSALERLAEADRALFDKTGTLTLGRPDIVSLDVIAPEHRPVALALAQASRHPLSRALTRALQDAGVTAVPVGDLIEEPGFGVRAIWQETAVSLGRGNVQDSLSAMLAVGDRTTALHFTDSLRPGCAATLERLKQLGIEPSVVSGDNSASVARALQGLGLTAQTSMKPQDKLDAVARLQRAGHNVLMVGDGLNDGPALAAGNVSMAPASASDVGQNAADAVFLGDSLAPVASAIVAARRAMRVVRQNFVIAIGYNVIAVPLAFAGLVTPLVAALAMSGSSIIVVANALRLRSAAQ
jgi:Cu2+-exporting ATPase